MTSIKVFHYIEQLDCFVVNPEYKVIADKLGVSEWNEVVWIGRYFMFDNDFGEHWFDNWALRDKLEKKAEALGIAYDDLLVLDPDRFKMGDGLHSDSERMQFWTDVLKSLQLSLDTIINEAIRFNEKRDKADEGYIADMESRIAEIRKLRLD